MRDFTPEEWRVWSFFCCSCSVISSFNLNIFVKCCFHFLFPSSSESDGFVWPCKVIYKHLEMVTQDFSLSFYALWVLWALAWKPTDGAFRGLARDTANFEEVFSMNYVTELHSHLISNLVITGIIRWVALQMALKFHDICVLVIHSRWYMEYLFLTMIWYIWCKMPLRFFFLSF